MVYTRDILVEQWNIWKIIKNIFWFWQIPGSGEAANSDVGAIPKTKEGFIDWSQVS